MSTTVAIYQLVIAGIIILGALLKGEEGLNWTAIGAAAWTVFHIFAPWLMLLQFATIAVAYGIGTAIVKEDD